MKPIPPVGAQLGHIKRQTLWREESTASQSSGETQWIGCRWGLVFSRGIEKNSGIGGSIGREKPPLECRMGTAPRELAEKCTLCWSYFF
jgi:hypothetical protein